MAFDRESSLKKAEKLLRQGRLAAAIAEYVRVVEEEPGDWTSANMLGDLYVRARQTDMAVAQYARIADHFMREGFYSKAGALYKKILKIDKDDENVQLQLAEATARQGLLADAKARLTDIATRRRARGDRRGEAELVVRIGSLDPADIGARLTAARTLEEIGDVQQAAAHYQELYGELVEKGRADEALDALRQLVRLSPQDAAARAALARAALEAGDLTAARDLLDRSVAGAHPDLLLPLVDFEVRDGAIDRLRKLLPDVVVHGELRPKIADIARSVSERDPALAFVLVDAAVDAAVASSGFAEAVSTLQEFIGSAPRQIPALLKLVEVCVDGGLESAMYEAQEQLTDAYLAAEQAAEARAIAEDLVAREPWQPAHIERFRRALVMLGVPDPDSVIAERLSGQVPFVATDHFIARGSPPVAAADPPPSEGSAAEAPPAGEAVRIVEPEVAVAQPRSERSSGGTDAVFTGAGADELDLTGALGIMEAGQGEKGAARERGLDHVFQKVREGAEGGRDFSAQHLTLAKRYLEIGMVNEAIRSFEMAARSLNHRFESASALGRLYQQRDEGPRAIEWFERAAESPAPDPDQGHALLYDLGVALESTGETARALALFLELQAEAGDYRDVPSRIERLARVQTGG
ncbi:MAG TPA: tetratricopeptide repeat protein [Vicinamibacterales bacterium]|nr:tetratricopeptide repeat protein [Vicinamibacterales bacterium]